MRIHSLQHVPFEDIGSMLGDIQKHGHELTTTHWYKGDEAPDIASFDLLIVMGGPMGVYDDEQYSWLSAEKEFIANTISAGKKIIGICLGAQLISCVLGATVSKNPHREIGWFPLQVSDKARRNPVAALLAKCESVFHWHGDTFTLPVGAELIASSEACANQAYVMGEQIYAFQFHLETTEISAQSLIKNCGDELDNSTYVQSAELILHDKEKFNAINKTMSDVFNFIVA